MAIAGHIRKRSSEEQMSSVVGAEQSVLIVQSSACLTTRLQRRAPEIDGDVSTLLSGHQ